MTRQNDHPDSLGDRFSEIQTFPRALRFFNIPVYLLFALFAFVFVEQLITGQPVGARPMSTLSAGIITLLIGVLIVFLATTRGLMVSIDRERLTVEVYPNRMIRVHYKVSDIQDATIDVGGALKYGGWGIRYTPWRGWGFVATGTGGVTINLKNKKTVFISSEHPGTLVESIRRSLNP